MPKNSILLGSLGLPIVGVSAWGVAATGVDVGLGAGISGLLFGLGLLVLAWRNASSPTILLWWR